MASLCGPIDYDVIYELWSYLKESLVVKLLLSIIALLCQMFVDYTFFTSN